MESKSQNGSCLFTESLFWLSSRTVRQLKSPKPKKAKGKEDKSMSNMNMAMDILQRAQRPSYL